MKDSSLGKVNYRLRPAKNVERKMFCEAFLRLSRIDPLPTYRYIGFGSIGFCDFTLFHDRLGIHDMVSIEGRVDQKKRVEFNRPYSCIEIEWVKSRAILPTLTWEKRGIVWLDYDSSLDGEMLEDIRLVTTHLSSGSVLLVTVNADPGGSSEAEIKKRLSTLRSRVGKKKVPSDLKPADLAKWGTGRTYRQIIDNAILSTLNGRNAAQSTESKIKYQQLFNFHYADSTKMLTVGGIFLNALENERLKFDDFSDLDFVKGDEGAYQIETPYLTHREMRLLDEGLPDSMPAVSSPAWLDKIDKRNYAKIYRYYPNFSEVEA